MKPLDAMLDDGVRTGVFGTARAEVWKSGRCVYSGGPASTETLFDLASLTKVMSTTALVALLIERGMLKADQLMSDVLHQTRCRGTVSDVAFHRSGLPAFVPFFAEVANVHPALFEPHAAASLRSEVRRQVVDRVMAVSPGDGGRVVYSDVGFLQLGALVEALLGEPLDLAFQREVAGPLGLAAHFRRLSSGNAPGAPRAPTGGVRPREPAPGQEGMWTCPSWPAADGEVDDDNAWVMDGVAGHAGLFGTASDVARFGQAVLDEWIRPPSGQWGPDRAVAGSTRAFGFDTPSLEDASCGARFGRSGPQGAIGHLGFTGTSVWLDLDRRLVVALLTNRVVFGRANLKIRAFRPRFHEVVLDSFG